MVILIEGRKTNENIRKNYIMSDEETWYINLKRVCFDHTIDVHLIFMTKWKDFIETARKYGNGFYLILYQYLCMF
jgi:hypothetical protein